MRALGGFYANYPKLSLLIFIPLFSLVGIPPLSGFWPKISLIGEGFKTQNYWTVAAIVWAEVFWKDAKEIPEKPKFEYFSDISKARKTEFILPIVFLSLISLYIGFGAEHIQVLSSRIANELMNSQQYIDTVLNNS